MIKTTKRHGFSKRTLPAISAFLLAFCSIVGTAIIETPQARAFSITIDFNYGNANRSYRGGLLSVPRNGKWGVVDKRGEVVVPFEYDNIGTISRTGDCIVIEKNGKRGIIDRNCREIIPCIYDGISPFDEAGLAQVQDKGKFGYIDRTGRVVIPVIYDNAGSFSNYEGTVYEELNYFCKDDKLGFLDSRGNVVIPFEYDANPIAGNYDWGYLAGFNEGLSAAKKNGKICFIDKTGKELTPYIYDEADVFRDGAVRVRIGRQYGFVDTTGAEIVSCVYDHAGTFSEGMAYVEKNGNAGFVDKTGRETVPLKYRSVKISGFREGLAAVMSHTGKWGFVDKQGNETLPLIYDDAKPFHEGIAAVKIGEKWGFIDKAGQEVIPFIYDSVGESEMGFAGVFKDGKDGLLNVKTRHEVLPCIYQSVGSAEYIRHEGMILVVGLDGYRYYLDLLNLEAGLVRVPSDLDRYPHPGATYVDGPLPTVINAHPPATTANPSNPAQPSGDRPTSWAEDQVKQAIDAGLLPRSLQHAYTQAITRAEFACLAVTMYESAKGAITGRIKFDDTDDVYVEKASSVGLVSGVGDNRFDPGAPLTREQAAVMLTRLAEALGVPLQATSPTFSDGAGISEWAYKSVGSVQGSKIMSGMEGNNFSPKGPYTREQSIATIMRLHEYHVRMRHYDFGRVSAFTLTNSKIQAGDLNRWIDEYRNNGGISDYETEIARLTNIEREKAGLPPLAIDPVLSMAARFRSQEMLDLGYYDHISPVYGSPSETADLFGTRCSQENASNKYDNPQEVVAGWMGSPGHRAAILNPDNSHIGVGSAAETGGQYPLVHTQMFR